jgi:hypothetical protein
MMRLAAVALLVVVAGLPVSVLPAPPVTWLAAGALVVGAAGVVARVVPLVTAGASLALVAYALALVIERPPVSAVAASTLGATLVLLLALVQFEDHVRGAALGPRVVAGQARRWLAVAAVGAAAAAALTAVAAPLRVALAGVALPVVVIVAALGALMTVAGVIVLVTTAGDPSSPSGR